ncbi:MAG: hypothetical protein ACRD4R_00980 [Candidatus Acidiferrales bacterium]
MNLQKETSKPKSSKASVTLLGHVDKIIPPAAPYLPERAQIVVDEADNTYREIRIENRLDDTTGRSFRLKLGAEVGVRIEADLKWTVSKADLN